jgi:hypothetical protein
MHVAMALHGLLSSVELGSAKLGSAELGSADAFAWIRCMSTAQA